MYLSGHRRYVAREWLYVCREKLLDSSVFEYFVDNRVFVSEGVQCVFIGRVVAHRSLHLHLRIQVHLLVKKDADLLWGHDVQRRLFRHLPHAFLDLVHFGCEG